MKSKGSCCLHLLYLCQLSQHWWPETVTESCKAIQIPFKSGINLNHLLCSKIYT